MNKKTIGLIIKASIAIAIIIVIALVIFFFAKKGAFDKELSIDQTANVVTEIKKISEFTSACYYEEIILRETKTSAVADNAVGNKIAGLFGKSEGLMKDEIVIVANGKVRAGFNLDNLDENRLTISGDTLSINLPKAEIFDVIVNPSDFDIYIEDGTWDHEKVTEIENKAIDQIKADALKDGIMDKATKSGVKRLSEMFKSFGYSVVNITVDGEVIDITEEQVQ